MQITTRFQFRQSNAVTQLLALRVILLIKVSLSLARSLALSHPDVALLYLKMNILMFSHRRERYFPALGAFSISGEREHFFQNQRVLLIHLPKEPTPFENLITYARERAARLSFPQRSFSPARAYICADYETQTLQFRKEKKQNTNICCSESEPELKCQVCAYNVSVLVALLHSSSLILYASFLCSRGALFLSLALPSDTSHYNPKAFAKRAPGEKFAPRIKLETICVRALARCMHIYILSYVFASVCSRVTV